MALKFKGWKTRTGKIIGQHHDLGTDAEPAWVTFGEHQANDLRKVIGDPGRLTPQYDR